MSTKIKLPSSVFHHSMQPNSYPEPSLQRSLTFGSSLGTRGSSTALVHLNLHDPISRQFPEVPISHPNYKYMRPHGNLQVKDTKQNCSLSSPSHLCFPKVFVHCAMAPELVPTTLRSSAAFTKTSILPNRAYVTFLAGNGDYVKGVVGLVNGLRKVKSAYPLVVAVLPDVPEEHRRILKSQGCIVREIEPVYPPENQTQFAMAYYVINYSKLRIWEFVEYSKMIYLDGDIQVYDNIDHLFDLPDGRFYAVMDCFCEKTWSHTPQYKTGYCQQCPEKVQWPSELGEPPALYFNAGMFAFEPSIATYKDLLRTLQITPPTHFAEQDFLNMYFKDIYSPIPLIYNLVLAMLWRHPEKVELDKVKVVHYCATGSKPWRYTGKEENMEREDIKMLVKKWWDIYNDESLDYKKAVNTEPFIKALSEAAQPQYVTAPSAA